MVRESLAVLITLGCITSGRAQSPAGGDLVVHPASRADKEERCVDVSIGGENAYGCINQRLKGEVDKINPPIGNVPPIDARSSDLKVGTVNTPAVQQQYGRNFGVSAFPYRPPSIFSAPLGRH